MRRALIVAYHYPPEPASGAQRMGYLAKYLPEFGWQPTVITRRSPCRDVREKNVIRVGASYRRPEAVREEIERKPNPALEALKSRVRDFVFFPDRAWPWIAPAFAAAAAAHRAQPFDAMVSSAMPGSVHVTAGLVARRLRIPWLADYRDLWTGNPYSPEPRWRRVFLALLERNMLKRAGRLTTITPSLARDLQALHARSVCAIANTVDAEEWDEIPFNEPEGFRIVHAGSLYDGLRSPERLFAAIAALRGAGEIADVCVDFYGPNPGNLGEAARRAGVGNVVRYHGVVERATAMSAERSAALLVVIQSDDPRTATEYGSKIFEYQAAGPRILAIGPRESVLRGYIETSGAGWFASTVDEIAVALREAHAHYSSGERLRPNLDAQSARGLAKEFATLLDGMVGDQVPDRPSTRATGLENNEAAIFR